MTAQAHLQAGLDLKEVGLRLEKFGQNRLAEERRFSQVKLIFSQFTSPMIYILVFAGLVTLFLGDYSDTIVIFLAVFLNTLLGFYQENKAQRAMEALRKMVTAKATVIRGGRQQKVDVEQIVPGDVVVLGIGNRVPADGVVIQATDLSVSEALLTGESMPVGKTAVKQSSDQAIEKNNFQFPVSSFQFDTKLKIRKLKIGQLHEVYMGTTVVTGIGKMVVTATGMQTRMGQIGAAVERIEREETPLQKQLGKLAKILAVVVGVVTVLIFLIGVLKGNSFEIMFATSVAVAVAAIPEGLVVSLTVILAIGMQRILKRRAIVRKLLAAETLGSVSVICADKTGTLTEGKMRVVKVEV